MFTFIQDLRYAFRQLRKNPGFTAVTVLTLALGIGVNAAMFAVIDGVLLRPFPFPKPNQVVQISELSASDSNRRHLISAEHSRLARADPTPSRISAGSPRAFAASIYPVSPISFPAVYSSANLLSMLQVEPAIGRNFSPDDDQPGHGDVVLINSIAWEKFFNKNPQAVGSALKLGNKVYTVIGVMPKGFEFPTVGDGPAVWVPLVPDKNYEARDSRDRHCGRALERRRHRRGRASRAHRYPNEYLESLSQARTR